MIAYQTICPNVNCRDQTLDQVHLAYSKSGERRFATLSKEASNYKPAYRFSLDDAIEYLYSRGIPTENYDQLLVLLKYIFNCDNMKLYLTGKLVDAVEVSYYSKSLNAINLIGSKILCPEIK